MHAFTLAAEDAVRWTVAAGAEAQRRWFAGAPARDGESAETLSVVPSRGDLVGELRSQIQVRTVRTRSSESGRPRNENDG